MKKLKQKLRNKLGDKKIAVIKKLLKVFRVIKNIVCWLLIAGLAVSITIFFVVKINGGTPSVFGYSIHRIVSGSMVPELQIEDVIVNKDITDISEIRIGDIVTFDGGAKYSNQKVTHRVLVAPCDDGRGKTVIVTKGDANNVDDGEIDVTKVESKFVTKVSFLRDIYSFFFSQWGLLLFIFLIVLIFFDELMNIVKLTKARSEQDTKPSYGKKQPVKKKSKKKSKRKMSKKSKRRNKR